MNEPYCFIPGGVLNVFQDGVCQVSVLPKTGTLKTNVILQLIALDAANHALQHVKNHVYPKNHAHKKVLYHVYLWKSLNENIVVLPDLSVFKHVTFVNLSVTYDHLCTFPELSEMGLIDFVQFCANVSGSFDFQLHNLLQLQFFTVHSSISE